MPSRAEAIQPLRLDPPIPPPWVREALGASARNREETDKEGVFVTLSGSDELLLVRAVVPETGAFDDRRFQAAVARCYVTALDVVLGRGLHPVRAWNFVPDIRRSSQHGFSRYELFNAGRQQGYRTIDRSGQAGQQLTASAVGHPGRDLVVHLLAGPRAPMAVENPRQRPSYRYSARYGPEPPCFSRASRLPGPLGALSGATLGLVAGTASIVGEDSTHAGDLAGQIEETFLNLATVAGELMERPLGSAPSPGQQASLLAHYAELRVYVVRERDARAVVDAVARAFASGIRLDLVSARLCRPELLVETEGILRWDD